MYDTVMIDKEELLNNKDFLKFFKNGEEMSSFFKELHKKAVKQMLEAELDGHLDNEKNKKSKGGNYRNGHGTKKIRLHSERMRFRFLETEKVVLNLF